MAANKVELSLASVVTMANQRAGSKRNYRHNFFSDNNMRAFNTKIPTAYLLGADARLGNMKNDIVFITADDIHDHSTQRFTIRLLDGEGNITNISEFQEYETLYKAQKHLIKYADEYGSEISASDI